MIDSHYNCIRLLHSLNRIVQISRYRLYKALTSMLALSVPLRRSVSNSLMATESSSDSPPGLAKGGEGENGLGDDVELILDNLSGLVDGVTKRRGSSFILSATC